MHVGATKTGGMGETAHKNPQPQADASSLPPQAKGGPSPSTRLPLALGVGIWQERKPSCEWDLLRALFLSAGAITLAKTEEFLIERAMTSPREKTSDPRHLPSLVHWKPLLPPRSCAFPPHALHRLSFACLPSGGWTS